MRRSTTFDMPLFIGFLLLVGLGIVFIYSASYPKSMSSPIPMGAAGRQVMFAFFGFLLMWLLARVPLEWFHRFSGWIIGITLFLLVLVLVIGASKFDNRAWIPIGPFQFQPSEFAKVALVVTLAAYLAKKPWMVRTLPGIIRGPMWYLLVPLSLIVLQKDFGTAIVFSAGAISMLALGGMKFRYWGLPVIGLMLFGALVLGVMMSTGHGGTRVARIQAWITPFESSIQESYQPRNSLIAVGSGGLLGRGLCHSRQKWGGSLPEAYNDYIFAIIAEELGFFRVTVFLLLYFLVLSRGFVIAHRARDEFGALVAGGATTMLGVQALVNIGVVINLIPCMGINLPFISYGGSSIVASMMLAGLILNVSRSRGARAASEETKEELAGKARTAPSR